MVEICPICRGKGKIPQDSELLPDVVIPSTTNPSAFLVQCHGCFGRGWVEPYYHNYPDYYPLNPHCPMRPIHPYPQTTDPIQPNVC